MNNKLNNTIVDDYKPRKWLLAILIILALAIIILLVNNLFINGKESFGNKDNFIHKIFNIINNDAESFNFTFESDAGTKNRFFIPGIIDDILSSNKKNKDHLIELCYQERCTTDDGQIRNIKKIFTLEDVSFKDPEIIKKSEKNYDVIFDYDDDGYINKCTIKD